MSHSLGETWAASLVRVAAPLRERVSDLLRQAILDFELKPGQRLIERELIDLLQVSRTTVRESLRELAAEGLVAVIPQRGAVVASITREEAADLYDARVAIELLVVARCIERASDEQIDRARRVVARLRAATEASRSIREVLAVKDEFYTELVKGADSAVFANLLSSLHARVSVLRATSLSVPGRGTKSVEELEALVAAIARRDSKTAARLCAAHIRNAARTALQAVEESERGTSDDRMRLARVTDAVLPASGHARATSSRPTERRTKPR